MAEISEELREKRRKAGRKGGLAKVPKGFSMNRELAKEAGRKGNIAKNANK